MGLITSLIEAKSQKDLQSKTTAINGLGALVKDPNTPDDVREWAANGIADMASDHLGGGTGQKGKSGAGGAGGSKGAGAGAGGTGQPKQSVFHELMSGLVTGAKGAGRAADSLNPTRPSAGMRQEMQKIGDTRPGKLTITQADRDRIQQATQKAADDEKVRMDTAVQEGKNKADEESAIRSAAGLREVRAQDLKEAGITKDDPRYQDYMLYGEKGASLEKKVQKPAAGKAVQVTGPDGKTFTGFQRQDADGSMQLYKLGSTTPLDPAQYAEATKEPGETGTLGSLAKAHDIVDNPSKYSKAEVEGAKDVIDNAKQKQQQLAVNIKNASDTGSEISDDELKALAQTALLTGQDPHIVTRNPALNSRYLKMKGDEILAQGGARAAAAGLADYHADRTSLTNLKKIQTQMQGALNGTKAELKRVEVLASKIPRSRFTQFNNAQQFFDANFTDDPDLAAFKEALLKARYNYNSAVSSVRGGGAATNQVRTETADDVLNKYMASGAMDAAIREMGIGLQNNMDGMNQAVTDMQKNILKGNAIGTGGGGGSNQPIVQQKGDQFRYSTDGGKTWQAGKPPQVQ